MTEKSTKTRFKDVNNEVIHIGDIIHVEEYPDKYVGGSLDYEGLVTRDNNGTVCATYFDIGEEESTPLSYFPKKGRRLLTENEAKEFWRTMFLGSEPEEKLYKRDLYRT